MKSTKVELDHNSLILMNEKYMKIPLILNQITSDTLQTHKLFNAPFDIETLIA
jgi:hypothetical protein